MMYGREPRLPLDVTLLPPTNLSRSIASHRERIVKNIERAQEVARANIQRAQHRIKESHDRHASICLEFSCTSCDFNT